MGRRRSKAGLPAYLQLLDADLPFAAIGRGGPEFVGLDERESFQRGTDECLKLGSVSNELIQECTLLADKEMAEEDRIRILRGSVTWLWEPMLTDGAFTFDAAYLERGIDILVEMTRKRYTRTVPIHTWSNRMFYGLRILLCRLNASVEASRINLEEARLGGAA